MADEEVPAEEVMEETEEVEEVAEMNVLDALKEVRFILYRHCFEAYPYYYLPIHTEQQRSSH